MNIKRVLFTGARAPIVTYMAQLLNQAGYDVFAADSTYASSCIASRFVRKYIKLPRPSHVDYKSALCTVVRQYQIDWLIPTCEEIFYISQFKDELEKYTRVLCDTHDKLVSLHDKWAFYDYLKKANLLTPHTQLASEAGVKWTEQKIIKPRFSRFASRVKCARTIAPFQASEKYLVQEFTNGKQICSYALVQGGKIVAQCVYEPVLTAGRGAGILLKPIEHPQAEQITARISQDFTFTGQIAFDFIQTPAQDLYVLECNPRATNGLGFLGIDFVRLLSKGKKVNVKKPTALISRLAVICYAVLQPIQTWRSRKITAVDFVAFKKDPLAWLAQIPIAGWWLLKGIGRGGPTAASTTDIEFNGETVQ